MIVKTCPMCKTEYVAPHNKRECCSRSCAKRLMHLRKPEMAVAAAKHMTALSAAREPWNKGKPHPTAVGNCWNPKGPTVRGGNGRGPTAHELMVCECCPPGFALSVSVGMSDGELPRHYKLDVADVAKKVCIEVDGHSHQTIARRAQDAKKDRRLAAQGWSVFRLRNSLVRDLYTTSKLKAHITTLLTAY